MSELLGFSRQAYYQHEARQFTSEEREQQVLAMVAQVREEHPRMGGKKLYHLLQEPLAQHGIKLGRDALFDMQSPHEAHGSWGPLERRWKNYYQPPAEATEK